MTSLSKSEYFQYHRKYNKGDFPFQIKAALLTPFCHLYSKKKFANFPRTTSMKENWKLINLCRAGTLVYSLFGLLELFPWRFATSRGKKKAPPLRRHIAMNSPKQI